MTKAISETEATAGLTPKPAERRARTRFELELPVVLSTTHSGRLTVPAETRNISSRGALMVAPMDLPVLQPLRFKITYRLAGDPGAVHLHCVGHVRRCEPARFPETGMYLVAVSIETCEVKRSLLGEGISL